MSNLGHDGNSAQASDCWSSLLGNSQVSCPSSPHYLYVPIMVVIEVLTNMIVKQKLTISGTALRACGKADQPENR